MKKDNFGGTFSAGIMARVFVLPQPGWLVHDEITTSSRLSLAQLVKNKNQKGFFAILLVIFIAT
jgi:hypothetical protein